MLLIRKMLFLMFAVLGVVNNAAADCKIAGGFFKEGQSIDKHQDVSFCDRFKIPKSDEHGRTFKVVCVNNQAKCVALDCFYSKHQMNANIMDKPDQNGICPVKSFDQHVMDAKAEQIKSAEIATYHKGLLTTTRATMDFFDACINNEEPGKVKTVKLLQKPEIKAVCINKWEKQNLSTSLALGLIELYNWGNEIGKFSAGKCTTQQNNRAQAGGGHSIRCVSDTGVYAEFMFGDMNKPTTSREDVATVACPIFGLQHMDANGNRHRCHTKGSYDNLKKFVQKTELMDVKNVDNGYVEILPWRTDISKRDDLSPYLDTEIFEYVVTNTTQHAKDLLKKYITENLTSNGYKINNIKFYAARSKSFADTSGSMWPVEISACKGTNCKNYIKMFKFRSLFGTPDIKFASLTSLAVEQMACVMQDGLFDSKHCFFLEEDINVDKKKCSDTNAIIQSVYVVPSKSAQAYFDTEDNMCVLKSSSQNAETLKALGIAAQIGILAITTITTAGAVAGVYVGAAGLLADGVALGAEIEMNKASLKFLKLSTRCFDVTCAQKYFEEEFKHMLRLMDRINDDEYRVIDNEMDRLVELLDDEYLGNKYANGLEQYTEETTGFFKNMSTEESVEAIATVVSLGLSLGSVATKGIKLLASRASRIQPKFISRLGSRFNKIKTAGKVGKTGKEIDSAADVSKASGATKNVSKTQVFADAEGTISRIENGTTFGRWKFDVVTDNTNNLKYYERVIGDDPDAAKTLANNISNDFGRKTIVFKRDNKYVVAVFDDIDDLNTFKKSGVNVVSVAEVSKSAKIADDTTKIALTPEETEWRALYEKYAPKNQSFNDFKETFDDNLDVAKDTLIDPESAKNKAYGLWTDFNKKYAVDDKSLSYDQYVKYRHENKVAPTRKTPGFESWSEQQLKDAGQVYEAQNEVNRAIFIKNEGSPYSTFDPEISKLKKKLQNNPKNNLQIYGEINGYLNNNSKIQLTEPEIQNLSAYINGDKYNEQMLFDTFNKDPEIMILSGKTKAKYQEFLATRSESVRAIDEAAGLQAGVNKTTGEIVAKSEFVQNFVSNRVSMYEDIITKNPSIYNRAQRWNQSSIEDREKLCKEIFEMADNKLGLKRTDFAVRDLVQDFKLKPDTQGVQINGNVYISSRHFPDMSFEDAMDVISHEQAHKVDKIAPNKGILGSQLQNLGANEGYIQGYTGHSYDDYRKELTEQSSWMIGDAMKKAISKLGL